MSGVPRGIQLVNILPGPAGEVAHGPIGQKVPFVRLPGMGTSLGVLPSGNVAAEPSRTMAGVIAWTWGEPYTSNAGEKLSRLVCA